ncbi:hypothetical protein DET65_1357 [Sunxiuqinia elliptica]|uniref:Uncharacterized protein n=1 Tax=Sunxiuqinia elliptica TaxID=655355 RepID=A0A4R6HBU3_9BACT|nr:hypothetical protein DET52_101798 [Sunxiuqinia elliptica]TDO64984.1 hypothetical protein DET65_1357 [Sunxiuqinia elliptica]
MTNPFLSPLREPPLHFTGRGEVKGFKFKQLQKSPKAYLYEVQFQKTVFYEVFERKVHERFSWVRYPKSNAFGIWAWTYYDKHLAESKFNQLTQTL